ncbi:unnamed protein product [Chondrus crispus]|uniref:BPTI/Kunitz inhibitor domain-containing protein n=1 Tax=Chondrus crispus TaxID=2769 RepID=R7QFK0_CHOCR|nr:unnamed protein product [Chondrus crispus]CDF36859.1 unnamed protein product [Chondrus crispus]|eukprot:XP_005716678.1 unnamed protein product [Chondrus crispus]
MAPVPTPVSATLDPCFLVPDSGPCYGAFPRYFYNQDTKKCAQFIWGGCHGVVPFKTLDHCKRAACNPCDQKPEVGPCRALIPKYFFDKRTRMCERFFWGGCRGNVPFDTRNDCRRARCRKH